MRIIGTQFTTNHKALEIYLAGCKGRCKGCHNPESRNFEQGEVLDFIYLITKITPKVQQFDNLIDNIWILGGEPLDQDLDLLGFLLVTLKTLTNKKIWLFTRFELDEIPERIVGLCDYIKTGCYDETQKTKDYSMYGIPLATKNQKIHKLKGE